MATIDQLHRGPGRPLDPTVGRAIIDAVIALVSERGYEATTLDAVAARAGASKPAIYRRWPGGKQQLVAAAVAAMRAEVAPQVDTGTLRGDLVAFAGQLIAGLQHHADLAAGLTQRLRDSAELARLFHEAVIAADRARFARILERAVERGELAALPEALALVADLAPAVVLFRGLVSDEPGGPVPAEEIVDALILPALAAGSTPTEETE